MKELKVNLCLINPIKFFVPKMDSKKRDPRLLLPSNIVYGFILPIIGV